MISLLAVAFIYLAMNFSIIGVLPWRDFTVTDPNADAPPIASIFMEKLCYLAFFHTLLRRMPKKVLRYYWVTVVFTVIAWIFMVLQQLITCPYFGKSSCMTPNQKQQKELFKMRNIYIAQR